MHTRKYQCSQFERDPIRNRQPVEFLEQRRYNGHTSGPHRLTVQLREERTADGLIGFWGL